MKKRLESWLLALAMCLSLIPATALAAPVPSSAEPAGLWTDGLSADTASAFGGGTGANEDPYLIKTELQFAQLAVNVNAAGDRAYQGKHFRLDADLELSAHYWVPIGTSSSSGSFAGTFDGRNHVIRGLHLKGSQLTGQSRIGLFGSLQDGLLSSLHLEDAHLELDAAAGGNDTYAYAGLLAGFCSNASLKNCTAQGSILISDEAMPSAVGSLTGYAYIMENCSFRGTINDQRTTWGHNSVLGFLAGVLYSREDSYGHIDKGTIKGCYADADVTSASGRAYLDYPSYAYYENCLFAAEGVAEIAADPSLKAFLVPRADLKKSAAAAALNGRSDPSAWVWKSGINDGYPQLTALAGPLEEGTTDFIVVKKDGKNVTEDTIVRRKSANAVRTELSACAYDQYGRFQNTEPVTWSIENTSGITVDSSGRITVPCTAAGGDYTLTLSAGTVTNTLTLHVLVPEKELWTTGVSPQADYPFSGGSGSQDDPFLISTVQDLVQLAVNVNSKTPTYSPGDPENTVLCYQDQHFKLTCDLDLSEKYWVPIGRFPTGLDAYYLPGPFGGHLDGSGHTISGMDILYDAVWDQNPDCSDGGHAGLFGSISGSVENLKLTNASIRIYDWHTGHSMPEESSVGLLAGRASYAVQDNSRFIYNCDVDGMITAEAAVRYAGGIAGYLDRNHLNTPVRYSRFQGSLTLDEVSFAGGIAGYGIGSEMYPSYTACLSAASIHADPNARVLGVGINASANSCIYDASLLPDTMLLPEALESSGIGMTTADLQSVKGINALNSANPTRMWTRESTGYPVPVYFSSFDLWTSVAADAYAGGDGSREHPYLISTPEQLAKLAFDANTYNETLYGPTYNHYYKLTQDLDLSGRYWEPIGFVNGNDIDTQHKNYAFRGFFDGQNHTIRGMQVSDMAVPAHKSLGLFGYVQGDSANEDARVKNVRLTGASLDVGLDGTHHVGLLGGQISGNVENCNAEGAVTATSDTKYLGGLIGSNEYTLSNCSFRGTVDAQGGSYHGGLIGNSNSPLKNSYVSAAISSSAGVCHPIAGTNHTSRCTNCFYNSECTPLEVTSTDGAEAKTAAEMSSYALASALNGETNTVPRWTQHDNINDGFPTLSFAETEPTISTVPEEITASAGQSLSEVPLPTPEDSTPGRWEWKNADQTVGEEGGTYIAVFVPDDPDAYQSVEKEITIGTAPAPVITHADITFRVVNGKWADGTSADKSVSVTLSDGFGTLNRADVPVGMTPNSGYEGGAWNTAPVTAENGITASAVYTYTFTKTKPAPVPGGGGGFYVPTYPVTLMETKNGSVSCDSEEAAEGTLVTITTKPDAGFRLDTLSVTDRSGKVIPVTEKEGTHSFEMPAGAVEVRAVFKPASWKNPYLDVKQGAYYYDAVAWADQSGITKGVSRHTFGPELDCTRAEIVTFLWRSAGSPEPEALSHSFQDVVKDSYYEKAVLWATEQGITTGTAPDTFSPGTVCTRAQAVTFLYRMSGDKAPEQSPSFADVAKDAYYADAVAWAAEKKITIGTAPDTFSPDTVCSRAEIVTFLYRAN